MKGVSNLIVLVESKIKHEIFNKKFILGIFLKRNLFRMIASLLTIYQGIDSE